MFGYPRPVDAALSSALAVALVVSSVAPAGTKPSPTQRAEELYRQGSASYSAADYEGAVLRFTEALQVVESAEVGPGVRSALLFNLGEANRALYRTQRDPKYLRIASEIYGRLIREGPSAGYPQGDIDEAKQRLEEVDAKLAKLEEERAADPKPAPRPVSEPQPEPTPASAPSPAGPRDEGPKTGMPIGLIATGSVLTAAGVGALVLGTRFEPRAEQEAEGRDDLDASTISDFMDEERKKGHIWMGVGGGAMAVGVGLIVGGAVVLAKRKRAARATALGVAPTLGRVTGLTLTGRF